VPPLPKLLSLIAATAISLPAAAPREAREEAEAAPVETQGSAEWIIVSSSGATLTRLSPPGHDAVRPRPSPDGRQVAYVRRGSLSGGEAIPLSLLARGEPGMAPTALTLEGDEIWVAPLADGPVRRRVASGELPPGAKGGSGYSLHDLSWSPDGVRIAFTWYDGAGWAALYLSETGRPARRLPSPVMKDPWAAGASWSPGSAQFSWSDDGRSGLFAGWDDECGSLYRATIPPPSSAVEPEIEPIAIPGGCRPLLMEGAGYWLFRTMEENLAQRVGIADARGSVIESRIFRESAPIFARWGVAGAGQSTDRGRRPPVALWWHDELSGETIISVWRRGSVEEWRRERCHDGCPEPVLVNGDGLWYIDLSAPGKSMEPGGRLMLVDAPGHRPREIIPARVTAVQASDEGAVLLTVISDGLRGSGVWKLRLSR
jgi:hypothetical protein